MSDIGHLLLALVVVVAPLALAWWLSADRFSERPPPHRRERKR